MGIINFNGTINWIILKKNIIFLKVESLKFEN